MENEDGTASEEIKERTYDLKCSQPTGNPQNHAP